VAITLKRSNKLARGFSLIEIMITMAIVAGILIGIGLYISTQRKKIKESDARTQIGILRQMVEAYETSHGRFPSNEEGLKAILPLDADEREKNRTLNDPWGNPYQYANPGTHNSRYDIWSNGPNNSPDTMIGSWE
jgi:general secretion pathway protein G